MALKSIAATSLAMCLAAPLAVQSHRAKNRFHVNLMANGAFEVVDERGIGARGLWCSAAQYARDVAGAQGNARLFVLTERGTS